MVHVPSARLPLSLMLCALLAGAGGVTSTDAAARQATELGAESPEALVERMRRAAEAKDMRELAACLEPESRQQLAAGLYLVSTMMVAFASMMPAMGDAMGEMAEGMAEAFGAEGSAGQVRQQMLDDPQLAEAAEQAGRLTERFNEIAARHGLPSLDDGDPGDANPDSFEDTLASVDHLALIGDLGAFLESASKEGDLDSSTGALPTGELSDLQVEGDRATGRIGDETIELVRIDGRWFTVLDADSMF